MNVIFEAAGEKEGGGQRVGRGGKEREVGLEGGGGQGRRVYYSAGKFALVPGSQFE